MLGTARLGAPGMMDWGYGPAALFTHHNSTGTLSCEIMRSIYHNSFTITEPSNRISEAIRTEALQA